MGRSLLVGGALLMASCVTTGRGSVRPQGNDSDWVRPTPQFQRKLEEQAARVPYLQSTEDVVEVIRFFVQARESAYDILLEMVASSESKVVGTALAALGATRDERLVPYVQAIDVQADGGRRLEYERARCLVKLGDWDQMHVLVEGLRDEALMSRAQCYKTLREAANETYGFHPQADPAEREASVQLWEQWLERHNLAGN